MTPDPIVHIAELADAAARLSDPQAVFRAVDATVKKLTGHRLFTLMVVAPGAKEVERIYSSDPVAYPLSGRKTMGQTPWGEHVIAGRKAWLGRDMDAIRWAFFDHELIASLGCGACINVPVCAIGEVIGTMNVLDRERAYDERHVALLQAVAPVLTGPFLEVMGRISAGARA
jgi:hypothetical protein